MITLKINNKEFSDRFFKIRLDCKRYNIGWKTYKYKKYYYAMFTLADGYMGDLRIGLEKDLIYKKIISIENNIHFKNEKIMNKYLKDVMFLANEILDDLEERIKHIDDEIRIAKSKESEAQDYIDALSEVL